MDRVDDNSLFDRRFAGLRVRDRSLRERLIASDEDRLEVVWPLAPCQALDGFLDDPPAVFVAAVGPERKKLLRKLVEIGRETLNLANVTFRSWQRALPVFKERHLQLRPHAVVTRGDELVDDFPDLAFGLLDKAVHTVAGIEQERDLHHRLRQRGFKGSGFGVQK